MARAMRLRVSCSEGRGGKSDVGQRAATSGARRYGCSVIADPVPIIRCRRGARRRGSGRPHKSPRAEKGYHRILNLGHGARRNLGSSSLGSRRNQSGQPVSTRSCGAVLTSGSGRCALNRKVFIRGRAPSGEKYTSITSGSPTRIGPGTVGGIFRFKEHARVGMSTGGKDPACSSGHGDVIH